MDDQKSKTKTKTSKAAGILQQLRVKTSDVEEKAVDNKTLEDTRQQVLDRVILTLESATVEELEKITSISILHKKSALNSRPRNHEELYQAIQALYGFSVPYKACSEDTQSPMEWIGDVWLGLVSNSFAIGNRGSGKTLLVSLGEGAWGFFYNGVTITHSAANLNQAKVAQSYLAKIASDPVLKKRFVPRSVTKKTAEWRNGSNWYIVTGNSMESVSGHHPQKAVWDELEFWDMASLNQTWAVPKDKGIPGTLEYVPRTWAGISTRQRGFGAANYLSNHGAELGVKIYKWNVFETMRPCTTCIAKDQEPFGTDDARTKVCKLWSRCKGVKAFKSRGFQELRQVLEEVNPMSEEAMATQVYCEKPSSKGVVFHMRTEKVRPHGNYTHYGYQADRNYFIWFDPSEGQWSVMYFVQMDDSNQGLLIFDELCINPCQSVNDSKLKLYQYIGEKGYDDPLHIVVDPRRSDAKRELRLGTRYGTGLSRSYLAVSPSMEHVQKKGATPGQSILVTLEAVTDMVCDGYGDRRLCWNPIACPRLNEAMQEYHYKTDSAGNVADMVTNIPALPYKDFIDPLRYGVQYYSQHPLRHQMAKTKHGANTMNW